MNLSGKQVLVTGATGFIGSHLVQALGARGAKVRAMAHYRGDPSLHNLDHLTREELAAVDVVRGNIEDPHFVRRAVEGCDVVFHLAALIAIPYSYVAPASYVATNISGTLNVLEACRDAGTPRIVHTSTSEVYGTARYTPIDEEHPLQGQSPYSASKIGADKIVESYHRSFGLPVVTLRPFNTFGPRQSARAVIPTVLSQALSGAKEIRLGSLKPRRDLTFVTDTARAFVLAGETPGIEGEVIHFGRGEAATVRDIARLCLRVSRASARLVSVAERQRPEKSEVQLLLCNPAKARRLLGWTTTVSLEEGLHLTAEFVERHPGQFRAGSYAL